MSRQPRRVFGLETEFGITAARTDQAAATAASTRPAEPGAAQSPEQATGFGAAAFDAEEAARRLFAPVLARARTSNRYLANGGRLYLDVGDHPEYATAECSEPLELLANDRAGEEIYAHLLAAANAQLVKEGRAAQIHLLKNNVDSAGNSFGCHENYLVHRRREFRAMTESLMSLLVTRPILTGAGHVRRDTEGTHRWALSVRADLVWDAMSSATTRSRPIVNTRDEPHADAQYYRRLHVIAGDTNIAQATTVLKIAMTSLVLDLLEDGIGLSDLRLARTTDAVRQISHDITGTTRVELADGRYLSALDIQEELLGRVLRHLDSQGTRSELTPGFAFGLDLWERGVHALRADDLDAVATELDWVAKMRLVERYRSRTNLTLDDPRVTRLILAYHDVTGPAPLARAMEERGLLRSLLTPEQVSAAVDNPPRTTRASLRGAVLAAADNARLDVAADWVRIRVEGMAGGSLVLNDPFATQDEGVDRLLRTIENYTRPGPEPV